ncbi:hypothetical protein ECANGB1_2346 [Enterospora canceri]|uniref:Uncharacterized protein n=1 Tax=Enterospora canceri TaxID=1081671 RepID=A0A1Y1S9P4_9MICR|nr:hypothetical protein ECANGB1_2346 [Enterospora canceri]
MKAYVTFEYKGKRYKSDLFKLMRTRNIFIIDNDEMKWLHVPGMKPPKTPPRTPPRTSTKTPPKPPRSPRWSSKKDKSDAKEKSANYILGRIIGFVLVALLIFLIYRCVRGSKNNNSEQPNTP